MKRRCVFVTVDGSVTGLSTEVRSTHDDLDTATSVARDANRCGGVREVIPADVMSLMQGGMSYIEAVQERAGKLIEPAWVSVGGGEDVTSDSYTRSGPWARRSRD